MHYAIKVKCNCSMWNKADSCVVVSTLKKYLPVYCLSNGFKTYSCVIV